MQDLLLNDLATSMNSWTMFNTDTETLPSNPAQHIRDLQEQLAKEREANDDLQAQNRFLTARCKELHRQLSTRPCVDTVWMDSASTSWSLGGGVLGTENHVSATVSTSSASLSKGTSHSTFSVFREPEPPNHSPLNQAGVIPHPLIDTDEGDHIYQYPLEERQGDATLSKIDSPYLTPLSRPRLSYPPAQRVPSLGTSDAPKAGCRLSWASVISTPDSVQSDDTFVDTPPVSNGGKVIGLTHGYPLKASSGTVLILDMWSVHRAFMSWLTTTTLPQEERLQAAMRYRLLLTTCIQECPDKISIPKSNSHLIQGSDSNPSANPNPNRFSLLIQATPTTTCKLSTIPSLRRLFHNRFEHMDHPYLAIWTSLNQPTNPSFQTLPKAHPTIRQGSFDFTSKAYPFPRLIVLSPSSKPPSATPLKASVHLVKRALVRFSRVVIRHRKVLTHPVTLCALVRPLCGLWAPPSAQDFLAATIWGMMVTTLPDLP
ncbi:hypothetical protein IWQ62_000282 [Dispira parvispora]|uniref:Uncharacterized protein n=1 Tax=Dispira parvispora TaxID=1520584 RepID=A0A9W8AUT7_9FUNG|nr:hypothetical protein IWQ62_000282 [Dispira parvispora]